MNPSEDICIHTATVLVSMISTSPRGLLAPVGLALVLLVAGCTAGAPAGDPATNTPTSPPPATTNGATDSPTATSTATVDPAPGTPLTPTALPDRPETLTDESAVQFAKEYERAYEWNRERTQNTTALTINPVRSEIHDTTDTGYVVHLEVGFSKTLQRDGSEMVGDGFYTANYLINESTIMRAEAGGQRRPGPAPHNGTVLEG